MIKLVDKSNLPTSERIGTYKVKLSCPNCQHEQEEFITKGVLIAEWNHVCSRCHCTVEQFMDFHRKNGSLSPK